MNEINKKLELTLDETEVKTIKNPFFQFFEYTGHIFGMIDEKFNPVSHQDTIDRLSKIKNIDELTEIIRFIVGKNWFFVKYKNHLYLLSSATAPSYYFYKIDDNLHFSQIESKICSLAARNDEKINPYELYDLLKLRRKELTPYGALFQNVTQIPCGHVLKIDRKFNFSYHSYFKNKKHSAKHSYKFFKKILESTAKLYVDSGYKLYIYLGGIDSLATYFAVKNFTDDIFPISYCQEGNGSDDGGNVRGTLQVYKDELNIKIELIFADRYSRKLRTIRDEVSKLCSSNNCRWDNYLFYCVMDKYKNCGNSIFLTGIPFDTLYGISFTKFTDIFSVLNGMVGRYFYTNLYQNNLDGLINRRIRGLFKKNTGMNPKKEYLYAQLDPDQYMSHGFPFIKNESIFVNDVFFKKYLQYKEKSYLYSALSDIHNIEKLSGKELNTKFRILRHYQSALLHYRNITCMDYFSGHHTVCFPGEGPLVDYFIDFRLGFKDIFVGKRYLHKYFREKTGKSYTQIFLQLNPSSKLDILKKFSSSLGRYDFSSIKKDIKGDRVVLRDMSSCKDRFMFSDIFRKDFFDKVDLNNPSPLRYLDNPYLIKYVKEFYNDAKNGLLDMDDVSDIYNLEIFLKNL